MRFLNLTAIATALMFTLPAPAASGPTKQMQEVLDQLVQLAPKPLEKLSPEEARKQPGVQDAIKALLVKKGLKTEPQPIANVEDMTISTDAFEIPIRVYTPSGKGPFPVIVFYHGGGWVLGNLDSHDASARALANAAGAIVVSADYRKAPEHKFSAAVDDAFAAYQWVINNAEGFGGDSDLVAIAGESAGGNLAAVVCLRARAEGVPLPLHQILIYPVVNFAFDTPSYVEHQNAQPLNRLKMQWFWNQYLNTPEDGKNSYASPLLADLTGLPSATVITADIDPLRSEGRDYADKLRHAGVEVRYSNYEGVTHEFFGTGVLVDKAKLAVNFAADGIRAAVKKH